MNCVNCVKNEIVEGAVYVYNGKSLCYDCLKEQLKEEDLKGDEK